jgi:hypothetical protein
MQKTAGGATEETGRAMTDDGSDGILDSIIINLFHNLSAFLNPGRASGCRDARATFSLSIFSLFSIFLYFP